MLDYILIVISLYNIEILIKLRTFFIQRLHFYFCIFYFFNFFYFNMNVFTSMGSLFISML